MALTFGILEVADETEVGHDIWPLITGEKTKPDRPRRFYWNHLNVKIALRDGDWKMVSPKRATPFELYNLADDPYEKNDLAEEQPERLERMLILLEGERSLDRKGRAPWLPPIKNE